MPGTDEASKGQKRQLHVVFGAQGTAHENSLLGILHFASSLQEEDFKGYPCIFREYFSQTHSFFKDEYAPILGLPNEYPANNMNEE